MQEMISALALESDPIRPFAIGRANWHIIRKIEI